MKMLHVHNLDNAAVSLAVANSTPRDVTKDQIPECDEGNSNIHDNKCQKELFL